jgi:signal transduction histidine kinase
MLKYRLNRYLALIFIAVVIVPAIVLSLLSIRAISREEAYIEKQIEGTLRAEVAHVSTVVRTAIGDIQTELASTLEVPAGDDPSREFDLWKSRSSLVEVPFLLSEQHEVIWPAAERAEAKEQSFVQDQQAFLSGREEVPVYENIAIAYKDEILHKPSAQTGMASPQDVFSGTVSSDAVPPEDKSAESDEGPDLASEIALEGRLADTVKYPEIAAVLEEESLDEDVGSVMRSLEASPPPARYKDEVAGEDKRRAVGGELSEEVKVIAGSKAAAETPAEREVDRARGRKGDMPGIISRADKKAGAARVQVIPDQVEAAPEEVTAAPTELDAGDSAAQGDRYRSQAAISQFQQSEPLRKQVYDKAKSEGLEIAYRNVQVAADRETSGEALQRAEEQRSIFVAEPLNFIEIVAKGDQGIVPRIIDNELRLLYWKRMSTGRVVGCLVNSQELRDRIIGTLPGIYSPVRILTILDEDSQPLIVPQGDVQRDWRRPFVAQEASELLPRWEVAAYLTDPDIIASRAQVTTAVMWILIFILFVSIVFGGVLVIRSASAEVKLAQQKTSFVANVSHELKTPLTSIRMFAEMLREGRQPDEEKRSHYLDIMTAETERLTRLINNVLDFSRAEQGKKRYTMRTCNVVALSGSVLESQRARLENNGFAANFTSQTEHLFVHADEEAIKQAVVNLLSNAEKYSGDVKVIDVGVRLEDDKAVISVSDRGVGIPPGEVENIFSEFYRVDDSLTSRVKGAGLGLTIARRIIRDHGGDIRYTARDGGGSTFEIILPIIEEQP